MEKAYEQLDRVSWNDAELLTYDQAEKYEGAYIASMAQKFDEGVLKGENKRNFEIARNMIKNKLDLSLIANITSLTIDQIKSISKDDSHHERTSDLKHKHIVKRKLKVL